MPSISKAHWYLMAVVAAAILIGACGGSGDSDTETTAAPTVAPSGDNAAPTTAAAATTAPAATAAPTTAAPTTAAPTTAPLVRSTIEESFVGTPTTPYSGEAIVDGEIRIYFNNGSNGTLVAIYHGAGTADPTDLCPGNSLQTTSFDHVSNAPLTAGACEGFPTARGSVRICSGGVWLYETKIPNDSVGTLWGSVEKLAGATIIGHTGQATNQPDTPVIDYSADVYAVSAMFTNDGSTEITCGEAMS